MLATAQTHALKQFPATAGPPPLPNGQQAMLFTSHWNDTILTADNHPARSRASQKCRVLYAIASQGDTERTNEKRDNCDLRQAEREG